jgi:hypothetical protein
MAPSSEDILENLESVISEISDKSNCTSIQLAVLVSARALAGDSLDSGASVHVHDVVLSYVALITAYLSTFNDLGDSIFRRLQTSSSFKLRLADLLEFAIDDLTKFNDESPGNIENCLLDLLENWQSWGIMEAALSQQTTWIRDFNMETTRRRAKIALTNGGNMAELRSTLECERLSWEILLGKPLHEGSKQPAWPILGLASEEESESIKRFSSYMDADDLYELLINKLLKIASASQLAVGGVLAQGAVDSHSIPGTLPGGDVLVGEMLISAKDNTATVQSKDVFRKIEDQQIPKTDYAIMSPGPAHRSMASNVCIFQHGLVSCTLQLNEASLSQDPETLRGMLFEKQGMQVPALMFSRLARAKVAGAPPPQDSSAPKLHNQPAGYSISVFVEWKALALDFTTAAGHAHRLHSGGGFPPAISKDDLDLLFKPYAVKDEEVEDAAPASPDNEAGSDQENEPDAQRVPSNDGRQFLDIKPSWVRFGYGVPEDDAHTIPYRKDIDGPTYLPATRLVLVRDLLGRAGKIEDGSLVGSYVLYAGNAQALQNRRHRAMLAASGSVKRWMEGIIISTGDDDMVEVLYANGWVIWHDRKLFNDRRDSNLKLRGEFTELLEAMEPGLTLQAWVEKTRMYEYSIRLQSRGSRASRSRNSVLDTIVREMQGIYDGFE